MMLMSPFLPTPSPFDVATLAVVLDPLPPATVTLYRAESLTQVVKYAVSAAVCA